MGLEFFKGVITARTTTGTTVVSPTGITDLKAVYLWATFETSDGITDGDNIFCHGFATNDGGSIQQGYQVYFSDDGALTSDVARGMNTTHILKLHSTSAAFQCVAAVSAWSSTSFTLNYTTAPGSAILIHYVALGGSDIAKARVFSFSWSTSTPHDVTVASGFGQPDLVMIMNGSQATSFADTANTAGLGMGICKDGEQYAGMFHESDAQGNMVVTSNNRDAVGMTTGGTFDFEADIDSKANWPTDGFRLTYADLPSSAWITIGLALKGTFTSKIFNGTAPAATGNQTAGTLASGTPKGALIFSHENVDSTTQQASGTRLGGWMVGGTDGTNEGFAAVVQEDANTAAICGRIFSQTKMIGLHDAGSPATLQSEADSSFSGQILVLNWNDADATAVKYWGVIFGEAPAPSILNQARDYG